MSKKVTKKQKKDIIDLTNITEDAQELLGEIVELKSDIALVVSKARNLRNDVELVSKQLDTAKSVIDKVS